MSRARKVLSALILFAMVLFSLSLFVEGLGMQFVTSSRYFYRESILVDFGPVAFLPCVLIGLRFRLTGAFLLIVSAAISSVALLCLPYYRVSFFVWNQLPMLIASSLLYWMRNVSVTDLSVEGR